jgi:proteasome lid subunit RPN8/RPN11
VTGEPSRWPASRMSLKIHPVDGDTEYEIGQFWLIVQRALGAHVPKDADADITLTFRRRRGSRVPRGTRMVNGRGEFGRVAVTVSTAGQVTHDHEYDVQRLFAPPLSRVARYLDERSGSRRSWVFEIGHPDDETPVVFRSPRLAERYEPDPGQLRMEIDIDALGGAEPGGEPLAGASGGGVGEHEHRLLLVLRMDMDSLASAFQALADDEINVLSSQPLPEGSVEVNPGEPRSMPFSIRKADEPAPPLLDRKKYRMDLETALLERVNVLLPRDIVELLRTLQLSGQVEEGGFLTGQVFRADQLGKHQFVRISRVLPAEHSRASRVHFTFTSDSFQAMSQQLAAKEDERLVGWWHTHPHGIGTEMGLSETDVDLHHSTFRQPWQVAGLINLRRNQRMIRFYATEANDMRECPLWTPDERDGYRHAGTRLGDL